MSGIWALVPSKRFAFAKGRLAGLLDPAERSALARAMLEDVLAALRAAPEVAGVLVVTAEAEAAEVAARGGARVLAEPVPAGLNAALAEGAALLAAEGAGALLVVPGDVPLATPEEIGRVVAALGPAPAIALAPDRHGCGTNALALRPPGVIPFRFGPESLALHRAAAEAAGAAVALARAPALALDLDMPEDLLLALAHGGGTRTVRHMRASGLAERLSCLQEGVTG
jgi:2-phospho-L-lactate/phosphoenolpyruvate guanylyltransferase